ncbi:MAG TPA: cupin domain-containing protein [Thermoanaerobaculia bacterium]|jgi:mannose-6-phosphate isomerase-like protein (cupin superfamily)
MPVRLEGGFRVSGWKEGEALIQGSLRLWRHATGAEAISLRVLEFAAGLSPGLRNSGCDEVLYVVEGTGTLFLDGSPRRVSPGTGFFLRAGVCLTVENAGPEALTLVGAQSPDPGASVAFELPRTSPDPGASPGGDQPFVRFSDQPTQLADDGRSFRVLVDRDTCGARVTQFVGMIPPGRAPDHFHEYEEVLCILEGRGRFRAGESHAEIGPGSCVFLPRGKPHCVENTGGGELRLLGVFYPSGSPAVRYSPGRM